MSRHAPDDAEGMENAGLGLPGRLALAAAAAVIVVGAAVLIGPREALARLPWAGGTSCDTVSVDLVVSPELQAVVSQIVEPVRGTRLTSATGDDKQCAGVQVRGQEPQETAASANILPIDRAPQIWIPDGPNWADDAKNWPTTSSGSLATTPVVIATSRQAAQDLGWTKRNPTWRNVLRGDRPVAVPDYRAQSESLDVLLALWTTLGRNPRAEKQVVATVLASDRQEVPSPEDALATARSGASQAPLVPATEQQVAYLNATSQRPNLVAVYPTEGSPRLEYPILSIAGTTTAAPLREATANVVRELQSAHAQALLRAAGFRDAKGDPPAGAGIRADYTLELARPSNAQIDGMVQRIDNLAKPSRILCLIGASATMGKRLDDGITRIDLAAAAARLGTNLLPDSGYLGAWVYARHISGNADYRSLAPIRRLGSQSANGDTQRSFLLQVATGVKKYLSSSRSSLYDAVDAAVRKMHAEYDPEASNAIILLTDGFNDDPGSITLTRLLREIRELNSGRQKVAIYSAALGHEADTGALKQIAQASGGHFYTINDGQDGQRALLDGLRRARDIGD